jgi:hypothetical protein
MIYKNFANHGGVQALAHAFSNGHSRWCFAHPR